MDVAYPAQLSYKQRIARELLGRFGKVEPILGMEDPKNYRCKVSTAFGYSRGRVLSGVWQASTGKIASIDACQLEDPRAGKITGAIKKLLPRYRLQTYDERTGRGFLRFVTIRIGRVTGEILVALGTGRGSYIQKGDFVRELVRLCPEITTIVQNLSTDRLNLILGDKETVLYGPGFITDKLCGYEFQISARSFFQINPVQTEKLYSLAVEMAELQGEEKVIDAYCGVGTIGIIASGKAGKVLAVEQNGQAVKNAIENVKRNSIKNVHVRKADAGSFMAEMARAGETADVVFLDPPRAGCSREFLLALTRLSPEKVVYISCNPETQKRDLQVLCKNGYCVKRIRPVDMFPYTRHVETVVLLIRKDVHE